MEGAEVLHDSDAPSPEATNPVLPSPEAINPVLPSPEAINHVVEELRKVLDKAFGTHDGGEALIFLRKKHEIHSLRALSDKLLKDDKFKVVGVCTDTLRDRLGIDDLRAEEAKLRATEAEAIRKAKDEEQKKEREARAVETAKEEAKQAAEAEEKLLKQAAEANEKLGKQVAEDARKQLLEVQGGALGSSFCVR
jgi:hypothetical protein